VADAHFFRKRWRSVCRPAEVCSDRYAPLGKPKMDGTPAGATERHEDFFFLSELRLHVLHALGVINWVWY